MAVLESTVPTPEAVAAPTTKPAATGLRTAAIAQWVVVGSLLAYGVSQTVIKASALFG